MLKEDLELQAKLMKQSGGGLADDLGGRAMQPGENMAPDQAEAARTMAVDYAAQANNTLAQHLNAVSKVGAVSQYAQQAMEASRTVSDRLANGPGDAGPPMLPGFVYLGHLFKRTQAQAKMKKREKGTAGSDEVNIYTDQMEALKTALGALGVYSDKNPGGMPIDLPEAKKIWFGSEPPDGVKEAEWRTQIEMGDRNIDPKKIRKFVNYDGSQTWEMLNEDKTVMSRFTMGEYKGKRIFAQGGYNKFAELLKKVQGGDPGLGFDNMRGMFAGG